MALSSADATTTSVESTEVVASGTVENDCQDEDVINSSMRFCANDPDFAVICAFLEKFAKELGFERPNIKHLQEWFTDTDEVSAQLRDFHIKLLRKTRKTVHEKSWESSLSKFCYTYSSQDAWEVERFGYKKSSLKVKLRIFRELLESQFERNIKFRAKIVAVPADSLRSEPVGRDRLGHSYWITQDNDCNLRIYQEHQDEEIWQVVATSRDELIKLISRLRGNEVVLPSADIGVIDEDTSSSNSCTAAVEKPPPPEEKDDSQEEEAKVPNIRIKLIGKEVAGTEREAQIETSKEDNSTATTIPLENKIEKTTSESSKIEDDSDKKVKPLVISQSKIMSNSTTDASPSNGKKRALDDVDKGSPNREPAETIKKARPQLLDSKRIKKPSKYEKCDDESYEEDDDDLEECEEEDDIDSIAADIEDIESETMDENVSEEPSSIDQSDHQTKVCDNVSPEEKKSDNSVLENDNAHKECQDKVDSEVEAQKTEITSSNETDQNDASVDSVKDATENDIADGETIEDKNQEDILPLKKATTKEPKATFFFGEPGCLKLSPIKQSSKDELKKESNKSADNSEDNKLAELKKDETKSENNVESIKDALMDKVGDTVSDKASEVLDKIPEDDNEENENVQPKEVDVNTNGNSASSEDVNVKKAESTTVSDVAEKADNEADDHKSSVLQPDDKGTQEKANSNNIDKQAVVDTQHDTETEVKSIEGKEVLNEQTQLAKDEKLEESNLKTTEVPAEKSPRKDEISEKELHVPSSTSADANLPINNGTPVSSSTSSNSETIPSNVATPATIFTPTLPNRKRRIDDLISAPQSNRQTNSDSEIDLNSENQEELLDDESDDLDIGGKRLKMRPKQTNSEIRKKVEAKKGVIEETTSSSGEEDIQRRRKVISPKRQLDKSPKANKSELDECLKKVSSPGKPDAPGVQPGAPKELHTNTSSTPCSTVVTPAAHPKQKPSLAEIIEKKLKKSNSTTSVLVTSNTPENDTVLNTLKGPNQTDDKSSSIFSPPKKSPITKPLKKNLLTQLRQEESDEEVPRKRTTSENIASVESTPQPSLTTEPFEVSAPSQVEAEVVNLRKTPDRKTPDRRTPERQRKRRSSHEMAESPKESNDEGISEKHKKSNEEDIGGNLEESTEPKSLESSEQMKCEEDVKVEIKKEEPDTEAETSIQFTGRRSGRRGTTAVVYSELPQGKRTRGAPKAATIKKNELKVEKSKVKAEEDVPTAKPTEVVLSEKVAEDVVKEDVVKEDVVKEDVVKEEAETVEKVKPANAATGKTVNNVGRGRGGRKKVEVDTTNIIETTDSEIPVRQSRRIALQKIKEEAERRKLEEIALRSMKEELKKKKKAQKEADPTVLEPSEHSSSSEESEVEMKKKSKKKCPGKNGSWSSGSEEQEEPDEEDEEPPHYESAPCSPLFKSDHEFSPESDIEDESQAVPMKRARTVRKEDAQDSEVASDEEACQKCGKGDHPEWILLCDSCDKGYHCSCLSPVLLYIPEGDWFCPVCQQDKLISSLEKQLQELDKLVECRRQEEELRIAEEAARLEQLRLEQEAENERKERKKQRKIKRQRGSPVEAGSDDDDLESDSDDDEDTDKETRSDRKYRDSDDEDDDEDEKNRSRRDDIKRRRGDGRSRRRAAARGARRRRRNHSGSVSRNSRNSRSLTGTGNSSDSSSATDSDDQPIYKLRKRRQINVSYRLNEFDDLITSALKKEMDEVAGAGNLGRGKDISTIIEADKEEKARQKQIEDEENVELKPEDDQAGDMKDAEPKKKVSDDDTDDDQPLKPKTKSKAPLKKKARKLTTLDITSEEDSDSDEDFKTSSFDEDEEDEDEGSNSGSTYSDSSLEVYRRRGKGKKKQRKAARRAARERRKDRNFVVDESDEDEVQLPKSKKKKRKGDSDYTESETNDDDELSDLSENMDSADLCDDTTSDESDGAWQPSKRKKAKKSNVQSPVKTKGKKAPPKKVKRVEYSDDDISETEPEDDDDEDDGGLTGKGSGKQPRSQPLKSSSAAEKGGMKSGVGKGKGKTVPGKKKKRKSDEEDDSFSDSEDSTRRTRGRRYAYLEDFDDDSSDGGIKPGVKRPDTPPEEREKFIKRQEEIKRMLAEKNAEGAKIAATPRLTPIKAGAATVAGVVSNAIVACGAAAAAAIVADAPVGEKDKRPSAKPGGDSLSTVPLSVIRQAKVLDIDYLQRKGEQVGDLENVEEVDSEFDDADLPDDLPDDMDEDAIARMVDEEEDFGAAAARELPPPDEVLRMTVKAKTRDHDRPLTNPSLAALSQMPGATSSPSGLQEPMRKRLPMPTMHPPLLRHQAIQLGAGAPPAHMLHRHPTAPPPSFLLQNALSAPLSQSLHRNFPHHAVGNPRLSGMSLVPPHLLPARQPLPASQPLPGATDSAADGDKPRGRRRKITPLRDALQKQQAAAAASGVNTGTSQTITVTTVKTDVPPIVVVSTKSDSVSETALKLTTSSAPSLAIAQPPQLYKMPGVDGPPSVITRLPHLTPHIRPLPGGPPGSLFPSVVDVARLYGPPGHSGPPDARHTLPPTSHRHRTPPQLPGALPPHHTLRPTYGPPPPLRGSGGVPLPNHSPTVGMRSPFTPNSQSDHHVPPSTYGAPPPSRHAPAHLNPYRPPIYGNPSFAPRGPPPGAEFSTGSRYPPYGYYPPPPPLNNPHQPIPPPAMPTHSTAAVPSSVIVSAPPALSLSTSAPTPVSVTVTPQNHSVISSVIRPTTIKSPTPNPTNSAPSVINNNSKVDAETRKKLITLEAYPPVSAIKSPLAIGGESSGSRSPSVGMPTDPADDSSSIPAPSTVAVAAEGGNEGQASEFSGLVSYFSSQHDDYNT